MSLNNYDRWQVLAKLVPFYLVLMGAVVGILGVMAVSVHSWLIGLATVAALAGACCVALRTSERLGTSPDQG
jgi:cytochrome c biogenesis factor